ncbi:ABC transporter ATP-binding protein [Actinocorallia sp. API 0066]|uniref:ABC transporter ATP-binding protein n=1 Tax=Actinocorallia sp. API 0066 TaxID=2896846 RepID=UPI00210391AB|nr:ATP-binding cassette domain-containing protein [Actinocorallia sp. API 0066]
MVRLLGGDAGVLVARELSHGYGGERVLRDVGFVVGAGEVVAVRGPSGSGKSSLLYCLAGVVVPDDGAVLFQGEDLARASDERRSAVRGEHFGFVLQFGELVPELSLLENVALPLRLRKVRRGAAEREAAAVLDRLGIGELGGRTAAEVSGGQAQRAAVARALVHRPSVVFADEPTGALDQASGELVLEALLDLARSRGSAVVIVTHDAAVAERADRTVFMRDGRVTEPERENP